MIKPKCMRSGALIAARGAGLSKADGLWLEEHVASCSACAREAALISSVVGIAQSVEPELTIAARSRAIRGALQASEGASTVASRAPSMQLLWGAGLAGAMAVAALIAIVTQDDEAPRAALAVQPIEAPGVAPQQQHPTDDVALLQAGERVRTRARTRVTLDHASVELAPQSEAQWNAKTHELALPAGELLAEVDPTAHRPFAVLTRDFRVEVLGTRFEVTQSSVMVLRGRVRIVGANGEERAVLEAGERYDHVATVEPEPQEEEAARGGRVNAAALLTQARDALAARELERSRRAIETVLAAKPRASARAEALTLRAELYNAQGDRASAIASYLEIATRFSTLAAGENALFSAARLEQNQAKARTLLTQYLERYPRGRFVVEAKYRLERSGP